MNTLDEFIQTELEEKCPKCNGTGQFWIGNVGIRSLPVTECSLCRGAGAVLTHKGRQLMEFIHRHFEATRTAAW